MTRTYGHSEMRHPNAPLPQPVEEMLPVEPSDGESDGKAPEAGAGDSVFDQKEGPKTTPLQDFIKGLTDA